MNELRFSFPRARRLLRRCWLMQDCAHVTPRVKIGRRNASRSCCWLAPFFCEWRAMGGKTTRLFKRTVGRGQRERERQKVGGACALGLFTSTHPARDHGDDAHKQCRKANSAYLSRFGAENKIKQSARGGLVFYPAASPRGDIWWSVAHFLRKHSGEKCTVTVIRRSKLAPNPMITTVTSSNRNQYVSTVEIVSKRKLWKIFSTSRLVAQDKTRV